MTLFPQAPGAFGHAEEPWMPKLCDLLQWKADELEEYTVDDTLKISEIKGTHSFVRKARSVSIINDLGYTVYMKFYKSTSDTPSAVYIASGHTETLVDLTSMTFTVSSVTISTVVFVTDPSEIEDARFQKFGLDACGWPDTTQMTAEKSSLVQLFNERFMFRMLGQETLERWQMRLQYRLDVIAPRYERAFQLYAVNATAISQVMQTSKVTTSAVSRSADTPDTATNASDSYADRRTDSSGSVTTELEPEGGILENINRNTDAWRNLADDFCREFENCFLNVFDY